MNEMKKWLSLSFTLLVAVVMSCGLTACGDDDDMPGPSLVDGMLGNGDNGGGKGTAGSLVGTWVGEEEDDYYYAIIFDANGTITEVEKDRGHDDYWRRSAKYTVSNNVITVTEPGEGTCTYTYSISGNTLELEYGPGMSVYGDDSYAFCDDGTYTRK